MTILTRRVSLRLGLSFFISVLISVSLISHAAVLTEQEEKLKQSVSAYQKNLEPLEPWQGKVFSDEILPQFQKFLSIHAGTEPTVDGDLIKSYLKFYAPKALQAKDPKVMIFLQWENTCGPCKASEHILRAIVRARLTRRGFQPLWVEKAELDAALSDPLSKVDEKLVELMKIKEVQASFVLEWGTASALGINAAAANASEDPEAELTGAQVPALALKMGVRIGEKRFEKTKVLSEEEQLEASHATLLNEVLIDLGKNQGAARTVAQETSVQASSGMVSKQVQVTGIQDFSQLTRVKGLFQSQIKNIVSVLEQKISRGQVTLAVQAKSSEPELQAQIDAIQFDPQKDPGLKKEIEP